MRFVPQSHGDSLSLSLSLSRSALDNFALAIRRDAIINRVWDSGFLPLN